METSVTQAQTPKKIVPQEFYLQTDVVHCAKSLLGKWLFSEMCGELTGGMIIEVEAYAGADDKASHAYNNRRTERTEVMFHEGGIAYVYLCYGMHHLLNVVTNGKDIPHAVLIRAIKPLVGIDIMLKRRGRHPLASGPGSVSKALGIGRSENGLKLDRSPLWIEDRGTLVLEEDIIAGPRIGVSYAEEHALLPWRFRYVALD